MRIAVLSYRSHPFVGGQGVYVRHLTKALAADGHEVTVFGGEPYPQLDPRVDLVRLPSLNLYTEGFPFVIPDPRRLLSDPIDTLEFAMLPTGAFAEPLTFSLRAWRDLRRRRGEFDVVHDVQSLGYGLLGILRDGWPLVTTFHHPIAIDRDLDLQTAATPWRRLQLRRWYAFTRMQGRVARRLPFVITGSPTALDDIIRVCGVEPGRITLIPYGVDTQVFAPKPDVAREPGRILTTTSSDIPLKGLAVLLESVAKLRTERQVRLVIVGKPLPRSKVPALIDRLELTEHVEWVSGIGDVDLAVQYARAQVAVVPSLYEGFSLPAAEAMACQTPLVATDAGALPWVTGTEAASLVPAGDAGALADAIACILDDAEAAARAGEAGRQRVLERFTWSATASATVEVYRGATGAGNAT